MVETLLHRAAECGYDDSPSLSWIVEACELSFTEPFAAYAALEPGVAPGMRETEPAARGLAGLFRARILANRGDYHGSLATLRDVSNDFRIAGMPLEVIRAKIGTLRGLRGTGQVQRSVDDAVGMLDRWQDEVVVSPASIDLNARLQTELSLSLVVLGRNVEALHRLDHAWNRFRAEGDVYTAAVCERTRGEAYLGLGQVHRAIDELERARVAFEHAGHPLDAARCATPQAAALTRLGRGAEAVALLEEIRPVLEHHGAAAARARLELTISESLLAVGLAWDARAEAREAAGHYLDLLRGDDAARSELHSALASIMIGEPEAAHRAVTAARRLLSDTGDRQLQASVRLTGAALSLNDGDVTTATSEAEQVLGLLGSQQHTDPELQISALLLAAHDPHDLGRAGRRLDEASALTSELGMDSMRLRCALAEAQLNRHDDEPEKAASVLKDALVTQLVDQPGRATGDLPSSGHFALALAFDEMIRLLVHQATPRALAEAWRWTSVSKAVVSDDYVAAIMRHRRREDADQSSARGFQTTPALVELSRQLDGAGRDRPSADVALRKAQNDVRRILHHRLHPARDVGEAMIPRSDAPTPEGPLLQFHVVGDDVVVLVIREGQVYARMLPGAAGTSRRLLSEWWVECSRLAHLGATLTTSEPTGTPAAIRDLGTLLVDPVVDLLIDLPDGATLAVVGHQHLDELPLEAMLFEGQHLSERFALRFVVGLDPVMLRSLGPRQRPAGDESSRSGVLVLAVPDDAAPAIADEAEGIGLLHDDVTVLVGEEATTQVLAEQGRHHAVVHFSCHGIFDVEQPRGSGIRLGDRWLLAGEIMDADLTDTVVVLNACATGRVAKSATDMGGLVWSFLAAGCAGVVSTTWPVSDEAASSFALELHRHLAADVDPATAVDAARAHLARRHPHPWQWAAFRYTSAGELLLHV